MSASITRDGTDILIRMPVADVQSLRVALQPCPCRATKSHSTRDIRARLDRGLAAALFQKPKERKPA